MVYAAFDRWVSGTHPNYNVDIVVTRDDNWGSGTTPFSALVDSGDGKVGQRVATNRFVRWNALMGQERLGGDLSIAVDPTDSHTVWIAWCDRVGGSTGTDWTVHVRRSTDCGQTWSADLRTITNVKNPSLAVNSDRMLGFLYQQFTGTQWVTRLELTSNAWGTAAESHVLHQAPSNTPGRVFFPYLGDYVRLLAVGQEFYGVFAGNNTPDMANFPSGVTYQRHADWNTHTLLNSDAATPVSPSIDPFFFHWTAGVVPIRGVRVPRGRTPPAPITPKPVARGPIVPPGPIGREPPAPIAPPAKPSGSGKPKRSTRKTSRKAAKPSTRAKPAGRRRTSRTRKPPTDIEL